jgi:hypothetical protein
MKPRVFLDGVEIALHPWIQKVYDPETWLERLIRVVRRREQKHHFVSVITLANNQMMGQVTALYEINTDDHPTHPTKSAN